MKSILEEIREFLEYLAKANENARSEENLNKKFGEERYKAIYNLIGGKYTGGLSKKEGDKRILILYIREEGLKFLEERQREREQNLRLNSQNKLTAGLFTIAFLQATISIVYYFFDLQTRGFPSQAGIFLIGSVSGAVAFFMIMFYKFNSLK
jgi:hypothetical protein